MKIGCRLNAMKMVGSAHPTELQGVVRRNDVEDSFVFFGAWAHVEKDVHRDGGRRAARLSARLNRTERAPG